ncbi:TIGR03943 family protein [Actinokineospora sp. NBRC 105648]|uniref:TIGR03943 family putative permease subunit n=1 Tax=Actinokineospora sp. NBRC 105648 TaxID=3032206 RepID=UPI0024A51512|nr:TIGR03943 family protein [Actinokineospora sp. NBRC 105648]GLZ39598.1 TIGR03943 family protein [Actinokineospora sp. NBRC 105648]
MRRETQNILLVLVGGALLKISFTGAYLQYVKPAHQPWLIGGGLVMVTLAAISIARDLLATRPAADPVLENPGGDNPVSATGSASVSATVRTPAADAVVAQDPAAPASADPHGHDHGEHHHPARSAWLLLLPVLAIFLIAPPALGADSVMRGDNRAAASRSSGTDGMAAFPPLAPGDPVPVAMSDFAARAAWDSGHSLDNRDVRLTGFIVVDGPDTFLARLTIACCAADAFPVKVKLTGPMAAGLTNDTWLDITGRVVPGSASKESDYIPTLTVAGLAEITQPENPYEQ